VDRLPETIADDALLALLGSILENDPTSQRTAELCTRLFQRGFSWQALVDLAIAHNVLPPLVFALKQHRLLPPVPAALGQNARETHVTSRLDAAYREFLARQDILKHQLKAALIVLNEAGLTPLLLKGAAHLTLTEPAWHEARAMRDLDILVPAPDADRASRALLSLGYRPDPNAPPLDRHLPELWLAGGAGTIEIHIEALSFAARDAFTTDEVWQRAVPWRFAGASCKILPPEWHLLHGLLHHQLGDRGHARRMLAVKGLWEFAKVGSTVPPQGWRAISTHAAERGTGVALSSWCIQANRLFGLKAPEELLADRAGRKHAEATFKRARASYQLRQVLYVADKLRFAFAPETLAFRYGKEGGIGGGALRHFGFLWRRRREMTRRWLGG
jgi:hypothetical protein